MKPARRVARVAAVGLLVAAALVLGGCVTETVRGDTITYGYELWVPLSAFVAGLAGVGVGVVMFKRNLRIALGAGFAGVAALGVMTPSLFLDRAVVAPDTLTVSTGIWGATAGGRVELNTVRSVTLVTETSRGRRGRTNKNDYLIFALPGGETRFPLSNEMCHAATPKMLAAISAHGIPIDDQRER